MVLIVWRITTVDYSIYSFSGFITVEFCLYEGRIKQFNCRTACYGCAMLMMHVLSLCSIVQVMNFIQVLEYSIANDFTTASV